MPQRVTIPFVGGTARSKSIRVNDQATMNLVVAPKGHGAKAPVVLESVPGLVDLGTAGSGPCRTSKLVNWQGDLYGVFGDQLVQISTVTGVTEIGTLTAGGDARCYIARGRDYLMVVDGTDGYTYDGTTFAAIADLDFPANFTPTPGRPTHVVYLDGFMIVNDADTDNFYISGVEDPTSWNALDFEAASVAPDKALSIATANSILYICGDETTQLYYNSGNPDFPYELIINATQEVGILAPDSLAESDAGVFFLATTPEGGRFVYRIQGQAGQVITRDDQDDILADVGDPASAYGFIYTQAGKSFYVLQLDDGDLTLVFNITAGLWEERELADGTGWRAAGHGILDADNIVGSRLAARYYRLDRGVYTDAGQQLIRRRVTQIQHHNDQLLDWQEVVIECQGGVGNADEPSPEIRLRHTNDDDVWSDQLLAPIGAAGERRRGRAVFRNLGIARAKKLEVEYAGATEFTIIAAYARLTVLDD